MFRNDVRLLSLLVVLVVMAGVLASASDSQGAKIEPTDDVERAVAQMLSEYFTEFSKLDPQAILPYFNEPCFVVAPAGVSAVPNRSAVAAMMGSAMDDLRAKGYASSRLVGLEVSALSAVTALATGTAVRYQEDGKEMERVGVTYVLQNNSGNWKIAVLVVHGPK